MPRKAQFFDRSGRPISAAAAHDERGVIRDGVITRVALTMADAAASRFHFPRQRHFADARSFWDAERGSLLVTDVRRIGGSEGNKPGFRVLDAPINRQAVNAARAAYLGDLQSAWRQDAAVEEDDDEDRTECPACEGSGFGENGKACSKCGGTGEVPDDDADQEAESQSDKRRRRRPDPDQDDDPPFGSQDRMRTVDEMNAAHQRNMARLLSDHSQWLSEQWKIGK